MPCQNSYIVERSRSGLHPACATKTGSAAHPAMVPASSGCRGRRRITGLLDRHSLAGGSVMGMSEEQTSGALAPTRRQALARPDFPFARVARRLGVDPAQAETVLHDDERAREAIARSVEEFLVADDERRAGRAPSTALALDPDFPTGVGMALVGAAVLWDARDLVPR